MVELIIGTYGVACWLVFKKFKLIPVTTYTVCTAFLGGIVILALLFISLSVFHPVSHDARTYVGAVQIVPNVRGTVIEVSVKTNQLVKEGDVLFRINPQPFQIEVDRLRASLASKNSKFAQLAEQLAAAEAATKQARANLLVSESKFDRQARETLDQATAQVAAVKARLEFARQQRNRIRDIQAKGAGSVSQLEIDRVEGQALAVEEEFKKAEASERLAAESLKSGSSSLEAVRQELAQAEAAERQLRIQLQAQSDGVNPDVRETMAQLEKARWDLDQTVVRAPSDGYVPQLTLYPGQMATPLPLSPLMVFIPDTRPALIGTFDQKAASGIKPGMEGEAVFKAYPGRSFKVKVRRVLGAIREGELDTSGNLLSATSEQAHGKIPVVFDYDEDIAGLNLPAGSQASVAVYTDRVHALSLVRKIILRMKSWENFVF
jgi:multidrug resistance efflux pump